MFISTKETSPTSVSINKRPDLNVSCDMWYLGRKGGVGVIWVFFLSLCFAIVFWMKHLEQEDLSTSIRNPNTGRVSHILSFHKLAQMSQLTNWRYVCRSWKSLRVLQCFMKQWCCFSCHQMKLTFMTISISPCGGGHYGRTVAPEAILFESPCRAHPET